MGSRGPLASPNSRRSQQGVYDRRMTIKRTAPPERVVMPQHIRGNEPAAKFWRKHAPMLLELGRLKPDQADTFALVCELHADMRQLADDVASEGWLVTPEKGDPYANPKWKLLRDSRRDFFTVCQAFGMTPASSARIPMEVDDDGEDDPIGKYLADI